MSQSIHEFDELDELLANIWEQGLDPQRCQRLSDLLDGDPRAQRRYLEHQLLHANLMDSAGPLKARHLAGDQLPAGLVEQEESDWIAQLETGFQQGQSGSGTGAIDPDRVTSRQLLSLTGYLLGRALTSKPAIKTYAAAAVLLLAVTLFFVFRGGEDPTSLPVANHSNDPSSITPDQPADPDRAWEDPVTPVVVATLTAERDAVWDQHPEQNLYAGQKLQLITGVAEITTGQGAVVALEAPASIELIGNNNALYLHDGKLVGMCYTAGSKGFVVHTRHADITDLGTEFGVSVDRDHLTTTVFTGEVELTTPGGMSQPLVANQTAEVSVQGDRQEVVIENRLAQGFDRLLRPAIVADARINLEGMKVRVVPRGALEDAELYTDRPHQLNGIDAGGLPVELLGGDLVMMPTGASSRHSGEDKGDQLRLDLDLAQPAEVYLIYPTHIDEAPWLPRDYQPTGLVVGLDLHDGKAPNSLDVGPGQSIDTQFSVWRRTVDTAGTLTAGYDIPDSMYAVIVVPASTDQP